MEKFFIERNLPEYRSIEPFNAGRFTFKGEKKERKLCNHWLLKQHGVSYQAG